MSPSTDMSKKPSGLKKHLSTFSLSLRHSRSPAPSDEANEPEPGPERDPTRLTPNTVWECHKCGKAVKVGLVGQSNYDVHVDSKDCVKEVVRLKKTAMLSKRARGFFKPATKSVAPTVPTPPLIHPHVLLGYPHTLSPTSERTPSPVLDKASLEFQAPSSIIERTPSPALDQISSGLASPVEPMHSICPGIRLTFPPGQNQHTSYPFGLHAYFTLPWNYFSEGEHFFLRSNKCLQRILGDEPRLCRPCDVLNRRDDFLAGIHDRIASGINENTPLKFFPFGSLIERIRKKDDQLQAMRLTKLNDTRMLAGKIAELDLHKQLMMAIATSDERRISQLIRAGLNNGESIGVMLERFYRACVDVHREGPKYNLKGFTQDDYMVGLCVLRLGGARLGYLTSRPRSSWSNYATKAFGD
ncbi:hypothetical protein K438DRAFT_2031346 [Mycena galopus ATCC 62051]|nr:hypothetical protein K438DRAFT_2031346 [Mycena galopus ATCC 62051]